MNCFFLFFVSFFAAFYLVVRLEKILRNLLLLNRLLQSKPLRRIHRARLRRIRSIRQGKLQKKITAISEPLTTILSDSYDEYVKNGGTLDALTWLYIVDRDRIFP